MNVLTLLAMFAFLFPASANAEDGWTFGEYRIENWYLPGGNTGYRIFKNNEELLSANPGAFRIISVSDGQQIDPAQPVVGDITGDGVPELIIEEFPRQPGCCYAYSIYSLGPKLTQIGRLTGFPSPMTFEDLNRNGEYEITGEDWTFTSWYASPPIVYGYVRGEFRLTPGLMRRPAPSHATLAAKARDLSAATKPAGFAVAPEVYQYMLELIYSGNQRAAWDFLDMVWPAESADEKSKFREDFVQTLGESPYWPEIQALNETR